MPAAVFTPNLVDYQKSSVTGFGEAFAASLASVAQDHVRTQMNVRGAEQAGVRMAEILGVDGLAMPLAQYGRQMVLSGADPMKVQESMMGMSLAKYKADQSIEAARARYQGQLNTLDAREQAKATASRREMSAKFFDEKGNQIPDEADALPEGTPGAIPEDLGAGAASGVAEPPPGIETWDGVSPIASMDSGILPSGKASVGAPVLGKSLFDFPAQKVNPDEAALAASAPGAQPIGAPAPRPVAATKTPLATPDKPAIAAKQELPQMPRAEAYAALMKKASTEPIKSTPALLGVLSSIRAGIMDGYISPGEGAELHDALVGKHYGDSDKMQDNLRSQLDRAVSARNTDRRQDFNEYSGERRMDQADARAAAKAANATGAEKAKLAGMKALNRLGTQLAGHAAEVNVLSTMVGDMPTGKFMAESNNGGLKNMYEAGGGDANPNLKGQSGVIASKIRSFAAGRQVIHQMQGAANEILSSPENVTPEEADQAVKTLTDLNKNSAYFGIDSNGDSHIDERNGTPANPFDWQIEQFKKIAAGGAPTTSRVTDATKQSTEDLGILTGGLADADINGILGSINDHSATKMDKNWSEARAYAGKDGDSGTADGFWHIGKDDPVRMTTIGSGETVPGQLGMLKQQAKAFGLTIGDVATAGDAQKAFVKGLLQKYPSKTYIVKDGVNGDKIGHRKMADVAIKINGRWVRMADVMAITGAGKPQLTGDAGTYDGRSAQQAYEDMMVLYNKSPLMRARAARANEQSIMPTPGAAPATPLGGGGVPGISNPVPKRPPTILGK